jgi:hypothetical protein
MILPQYFRLLEIGLLELTCAFWGVGGDEMTLTVVDILISHPTLRSQ